MVIQKNLYGRASSDNDINNVAIKIESVRKSPCLYNLDISFFMNEINKAKPTIPPSIKHKTYKLCAAHSLK